MQSEIYTIAFEARIKLAFRQTRRFPLQEHHENDLFARFRKPQRCYSFFPNRPHRRVLVILSAAFRPESYCIRLEIDNKGGRTRVNWSRLMNFRGSASHVGVDLSARKQTVPTYWAFGWLGNAELPGELASRSTTFRLSSVFWSEPSTSSSPLFSGHKFIFATVSRIGRSLRMFSVSRTAGRENLFWDARHKVSFEIWKSSERIRPQNGTSGAKNVRQTEKRWFLERRDEDVEAVSRVWGK